MGLGDRYAKRGEGEGDNKPRPAAPVSNRVTEKTTKAEKEQKKSNRNKSVKKRQKSKEKIAGFVSDLKADVDEIKETYNYENHINVSLVRDLQEQFQLLAIETGMPMKELIAVASIRFLDECRNHSQLLNSY